MDIAKLAKKLRECFPRIWRCSDSSEWSQLQKQDLFTFKWLDINIDYHKIDTIKGGGSKSIKPWVNDLQEGDLIFILGKNEYNGIALTESVYDYNGPVIQLNEEEYFPAIRIKYIHKLKNRFERDTTQPQFSSVSRPSTFSSIDRSGFSLENTLELLQELVPDSITTLQKYFDGKTINSMNRSQPLNQILYGPPGTGKTYHTINKAIEIIDDTFDINQDRSIVKAKFDRLVATGQIAFTTFHQSMTYEDFVEGIKPRLDDNSTDVAYQIEEGIFKKISELARIPTIDNFDKAYDDFLNSFEDSTDEIIQLTSPQGSSFGVSINSNGNLNLHTGVSQNYQGVLTRIRIKNQFTGVQKNKWHPGYFEGVINHLKDNYNLEEPSHDITKNYVLIIDEINRGNVSAIFGELITLIEESKRLGSDEELTVTLPYSKTVLGVPTNLYIIGTMNTADRSIEALDTALRRRFSFTEMSPDPTLITQTLTINNEEFNLSEMLRVINRRIEVLLDKDHLIGHSFFMPVKDTEGLQKAFARQIIPLLQEYFYGDYGKIALVLGKGFCSKKPQPNNAKLFADTEYDGSFVEDKVIYEVKMPQGDEFVEALKKLMNQPQTNNG